MQVLCLDPALELFVLRHQCLIGQCQSLELLFLETFRPFERSAPLIQRFHGVREVVENVGFLVGACHRSSEFWLYLKLRSAQTNVFVNS